ncbi:hypothetical protein K1719_032814 [Acacia pycnantha]|nr:hypothetical protein K1719_032814 [Acacia pycnantha]
MGVSPFCHPAKAVPHPPPNSTPTPILNLDSQDPRPEPNCTAPAVSSSSTAKHSVLSTDPSLIESEIQKWIDRKNIGDLSRALKEPMRNEEELVKLLVQFEEKIIK